jgi:ATP-dependent helicase YprA (DUF1998 family)
MSDLNPIRFRDELDATLRRYLATSLPIAARFPELRRRFRELLANETLVRGPFVESLPDFEKGATLRALVKEDVLHDGWLRLDASARHLLDRRLHTHQEAAIRAAQRENLVVATGTGSGKTECFLYPAIDRLLRDPALHEPGVRVLLLYPLNALANDQLYFRLAPLLLRDLKGTGINFGRFTSAVAANAQRSEIESDLLRNTALAETLGNPDRIPESWLLTREEMLDAPPHVLITNYAMLEHLLLLPRNAPLLAQARLGTIVLDEIHTYHGAQAIEVAFLLRKLRTRLGLASEQLRCVGTSATLGAGEEAERSIMAFASSLFGAPVTKVISGCRKPHAAFSQSVSSASTPKLRTRWPALSPPACFAAPMRAPFHCCRPATVSRRRRSRASSCDSILPNPSAGPTFAPAGRSTSLMRAGFRFSFASIADRRTSRRSRFSVGSSRARCRKASDA